MDIREDISSLNAEDRKFIDYLRGALILRVVLTHLGLSWFFLPYSSYIEMFFPALFLVSGMVTYNSFIGRKTGNSKFFLRRNVNLLTTYYLISGLALVISFVLAFSGTPSLPQIIDWLLINQKAEDQPYHMTQVWFLRSLVVITIFSVPFFILSEKKNNILLIPVALSLIAGSFQLLTPIGRSFSLQIGDLNGFNFFHPLANFGYFCFGAWAVRSGFLWKTRTMLILAASLLMASILVFKIFSLDPRLNYHSYYQNLYYMLIGYTAIFSIFFLRNPIKTIIEKIKAARNILIFFSYHAFSIFLIHSFFIVFSEAVFGWKNSSSPEVIIPKILFVLMCSCIFSIPLTYLSKKTSTFIINKLHLK